LFEKTDRSLGPYEESQRQTRYVFEIKRAKAGWTAIEKDLVRLHSYLDVANPSIRCFCIVTSENKTYHRLIRNGAARRGNLVISKNCSGHFAVRRVIKAGASFRGHNTAHYVCLLEVFLENQEHKAL